MELLRFPSRVAEISSELLNNVLSERQPGVQVEQFEVLETSQCGEGLASTADRVLLRLTYAAGCDAGLPPRMLLKTMLLAPHAPRSMYQNEVNFYRDVRPELDIEAPRAYASMFDAETGQFGILMEDLNARSARFPYATTPITLQEMSNLVKNMAKLHAHFWQSPRLKTDLSWVPTPCSGGMYNIFYSMGYELIKNQLEKNPFKQVLIEPLNRSLEEMWSDLWKMQEVLGGTPRTLLHGDPHIANTYLLPDGTGGLLDWQLMIKGVWSHDLTYLLVTGLSTEQRRTHEHDLIQLYLEELKCQGVDAPDKNEAWLLYRQSVVWGLVIGWLITPPVNYGEEITRANISRLVTAALELETFQAIPS
jgi:hypothetical protein